MKRKKRINFSSKKKKNIINIKYIGLIIIIVAFISVIGFKGVTATTAFIEEKRQERIETPSAPINHRRTNKYLPDSRCHSATGSNCSSEAFLCGGRAVLLTNGA